GAPAPAHWRAGLADEAAVGHPGSEPTHVGAQLVEGAAVDVVIENARVANDPGRIGVQDGVSRRARASDGNDSRGRNRGRTESRNVEGHAGKIVTGSDACNLRCIDRV